jgi:hypothetical protein
MAIFLVLKANCLQQRFAIAPKTSVRPNIRTNIESLAVQRLQ